MKSRLLKCVIHLICFVVGGVFLVACSATYSSFGNVLGPARYVVKRGDTVYSIAWRYQQDYRDLIAWNNLSAPYVIYPGQRLHIRSESGSRNKKNSHTNKVVARISDNKKTKKKSNKKTTERSQKKPQKVTVNSDNRWRWPLKGKLLSTFSSSARDRNGINIEAKKGQKVEAARAGVVVYSGVGMRTHGKLILIKHNERFLSAYAYNSQLLVNEGDQVKIGQIIARAGHDHQRVTKLYFEIRNDGNPVDPLKYLPKH